MTIRTHFHLALIVCTLIFVMVFFTHERIQRQNNLEQIERHARVIRNALWNLDPEGPREYLTLAAMSNGYEEVEILDLMNPSLDQQRNYERMRLAAEELERLRTAMEQMQRLNVANSDLIEQQEATIAKYRDTLRSIGQWSQQIQDLAEKTDSGIMLWRGCVAEANQALKDEGDGTS